MRERHRNHRAVYAAIKLYLEFGPQLFGPTEKDETAAELLRDPAWVLVKQDELEQLYRQARLCLSRTSPLRRHLRELAECAASHSSTSKPTS